MSPSAENDGYRDRVAEKAAQIRLARLVLAVLVLPLYVIGWAAALVWCAVAWSAAGVAVGWSDARARFGPVGAEPELSE